MNRNPEYDAYLDGQREPAPAERVWFITMTDTDTRIAGPFTEESKARYWKIKFQVRNPQFTFGLEALPSGQAVSIDCEKLLEFLKCL
jgi:hypothetical protein